MKIFYLVVLTIFIISCEETETSIANSSSTVACKGIYTVKDSNELIVQRFDEHYITSLGCVTDNLPLSTFEKQEIVRHEQNIQCSPQNIPSVTLLSKNNYYWPRNDSIYLDLNSETGQFRRLIVGKTASGVPLFQREIGCWYQREDLETEAVNPKDYGKQLLLDLELASSSLEVHPMEVYRYTKTGANWDTVRFDDPTGVDWTFCPADSSPWEYCTALRNGSYMYYPDSLTAPQMAALQGETLLIRSQYNFVEISNSDFEAKWTATINSAKEFGTTEAIQNNYKFQYGISGLPDIKPFIDRTWRAYLRREYPQMADTDSVGLPLICYFGFRDVVLENGDSAVVHGEICYSNGIYSFVQN